MPVYKVLDPNGVLVLTPAAQVTMPQGSIIYLVSPPSAPPDTIVPPGIGPGGTIPPGSNYAGWLPPAFPGDPGYFPQTQQGLYTAQALAAGRIMLMSDDTPVTPAPGPLPGAYLSAGCPPAGSVPYPAPLSGSNNRLLYAELNGQPGLHIATRN